MVLYLDCPLMLHPSLPPSAGDCCPSTCNTAIVTIEGACRQPGQFDHCRDINATIDTTPPQLFGVPSRPLLMEETLLNITAQPGNSPVFATDNFPCFNPTIAVTTRKLTAAPAGVSFTLPCGMKVGYYVQRNWTATDRARLSSRASQYIAVVVSDVPSFPKPLTRTARLKRGFVVRKQTVNVIVSVPGPVAGKIYTWTLTKVPSAAAFDASKVLAGLKTLTSPAGIVKVAVKTGGYWRTEVAAHVSSA